MTCKSNSNAKPNPGQHHSSFHLPLHSNAGLVFLWWRVNWWLWVTLIRWLCGGSLTISSFSSGVSRWCPYGQGGIPPTPGFPVLEMAGIVPTPKHLVRAMDVGEPTSIRLTLVGDSIFTFFYWMETSQMKSKIRFGKMRLLVGLIGKV